MTNSELAILDFLLGIIDEMPLTECCGKVPADHRESGRCYYCHMTADWCQCETDDICRCGAEN